MAEELLDFSKEAFNVDLFDQVVNTFYYGTGEEQNLAQNFLTQFQEHPESWRRVDVIIEFSQSNNSKFLALQILERTIKYRWKSLPQEQQDGIKDYILRAIMNLSEDSERFRANKIVVSKLNQNLVEIVKQDWPKNWSTFVQDMIKAGQISLSTCENVMSIFKFLSQEVFDFNKDQLTTSKTTELKNTFHDEISSIFEFCQYVLENGDENSLLTATLSTFLSLLNWIPLGYIFQTKIIKLLTTKFLSNPETLDLALQCLTEIAGLKSEIAFDEEFINLYQLATQTLSQHIQPTSNFLDIYDHGTEKDRNFLRTLSIFLTTFLKHHIKILEKSPKILQDDIKNSLTIIILLSEVYDIDMFKICLDYWYSFASDLFHENNRNFPMYRNIHIPQHNYYHTNSYPQYNNRNKSKRGEYYESILSKVRLVLISKMAKPEEVLVVEDDNGELIREYAKDTDAIELYKSMRQSLVLLTHLNYQDTQIIMLEKLKKINPYSFSWNDLNTLCWAIGSISGAMSGSEEKNFLVKVIKMLLSYCEQTKGKDNKAVVASNIMYIVGQYPRFLKTNWSFLKTVAMKLFEFMHEPHPGIKDMSLHHDQKVIIRINNSHTVVDSIGNIIDKLMNQNENIQKFGDSSVLFPNQKFEILTVNENEKVDWKPITAFSRHKTSQKLIKVSTKTKRSTIATKNHSFLLRDKSSLKPILGSNLKANIDRIPLLKKLIIPDSYLIKYVDFNSNSNQNLIELDFPLGFLFGAYFNIGKIEENKNSLIYQSQQNPNLLKYLQSLIQFKFDIPNLQTSNSSTSLKILFKPLINFIDHFSSKFFNSINEDNIINEKLKYPSSLFSLLLFSPLNFLSGFFSGFYHSNQNQNQNVNLNQEINIEIVNESFDFSEMLQMILTRFNILSQISDKNYFGLKIIGKNSIRFLEMIKLNHFVDNDFEYTNYMNDLINSKILTTSKLNLQEETEIYNQIPFNNEQEVAPSFYLKSNKKEANSFGSSLESSYSTYEMKSKLIEMEKELEQISQESKNILNHLENTNNNKNWKIDEIEKEYKQTKEYLIKKIGELKQALNADVFYDLITDIQEVSLGDGEYVYDFSVESNETFMLFNTIFVHNSCDTFLKIATKCKLQFSKKQDGESDTFVEDTISKLNLITSDLENQQVLTFYEALGIIISSARKSEKEKLVEKLMNHHNTSWSQLLSLSKSDENTLNNIQICKDLVYILRANVRTSSTVGGAFIQQFNFIYEDALFLYKAFSVLIKKIISSEGTQIVKSNQIRNMKAVKKEIIILIQTFFQKCEDPQPLMEEFFPRLFEVIFDDYKNNFPEARIPELLLFLSIVISILQTQIISYIPSIFESTFECTLEMISSNFEDFPDFRFNFYKLLESINKFSFDSLFMLTSQNFKVIVDSIIWAFKHTERNISETGLSILLDLFRNVLLRDEILNDFFQTFYLSLIQEIFNILTDTFHKTGFAL
ncbi:intein-containing exportin-1 precursor [Anaeramoeba ignava]|uniref:Exportin-1 n=1 Tax=Anaeramoeba ignava TaxID=1746090 RepID=A0A9Q0RBA6_ANAIG|nr:intein-containing exportin-1 precursor [Anaeramoeba ignava]